MVISETVKNKIKKCFKASPTVLTLLERGDYEDLLATLKAISEETKENLAKINEYKLAQEEKIELFEVFKDEYLKNDLPDRYMNKQQNGEFKL